MIAHAGRQKETTVRINVIEVKQRTLTKKIQTHISQSLFEEQSKTLILTLELFHFFKLRYEVKYPVSITVSVFKLRGFSNLGSSNENYFNRLIRRFNTALLVIDYNQ